MRSRFPHGGDVLGAAPANPILAPVLSQDRGLSMSRQRDLLDLQAIQRISGLVGYWKADPQYLFEDSAGTTPASTSGTGVVGLQLSVTSPVIPWSLVQRLGTEASVRSLVSLGGGVVLAGTQPTGQVYRSTDSGQTWSLVQRLGTETHVLSLVSLGGGVVLAGTLTTGQVYRSTDSGQTWTLVQRLGTEQHVYSLVSLGGGVVLAGTFPTGQVYRSTDSGQTWSLVQRLGTEATVNSLVSLGGGVVLAGTQPTGQVYRSTDSGQTWSLVQRLGTETHVLSLVSLGGGVVLAGTFPTGQVYRSTDSGQTWSLVQRLGTETHVLSLVSLGGGVVLAGTLTTGQVYRSTDSGQTWTLVQRLGTETHVYSLVSLGGGVVLAGTYPTGQVYRSTFDGAPSIAATQTTTANKPILRKTPTTGVYWADSNTTTSALNVALGNLGSACTVARSSAEGVTFTENVTISSTYNIAPIFDFNSDVAIFNRALTATEKALIARYMARAVPLLGSNLVTNGTFDTDTAWTKGTGWSIGSGVASKSAGTASNLTQSVGVSGAVYYAKADAVVTAGTIGAYPGSGTIQFGSTSATGTLAHVMKASGTGIGVRGDASFAGSVDNAAIKEIL